MNGGQNMPQKSFPLRTAPELYEAVMLAAKRKNLSANAYWVEAMKAYLKAEEDREWAASFEAMADDKDSMDVEYAIYAQAEVMLANPS
jgi:hypothetical protein